MMRVSGKKCMFSKWSVANSYSLLKRVSLSKNCQKWCRRRHSQPLAQRVPGYVIRRLSVCTHVSHKVGMPLFDSGIGI